MKKFGRIVAWGAFLAGVFALPLSSIDPAHANCCSRVAGGCDSASEMGCAMGSSQNMFFDDPCECNQQTDSCEDPTQNNEPCGGTPGGECGDDQVDGGEDCDDGALNGSFESCCTMDCQYKSDGALCEDGTFCDGLGACNGSGTCVENAGGDTCPDPERCNEEERSCNEADAPAASTLVLAGLSGAMLLGALAVLRRRRTQQLI